LAKGVDLIGTRLVDLNDLNDDHTFETLVFSVYKTCASGGGPQAES
jgi:hypothetical protein